MTAYPLIDCNVLLSLSLCLGSSLVYLSAVCSNHNLLNALFNAEKWEETKEDGQVHRTGLEFQRAHRETLWDDWNEQKVKKAHEADRGGLAGNETLKGNCCIILHRSMTLLTMWQVKSFHGHYLSLLFFCINLLIPLPASLPAWPPCLRTSSAMDVEKNYKPHRRLYI